LLIYFTFIREVEWGSTRAAHNRSVNLQPPLIRGMNVYRISASRDFIGTGRLRTRFCTTRSL